MITLRAASSNPILRSSDDILADIWAALWKEETVRSIDWTSISVQIQDGEVLLEGHVTRDQNRQLIEGIARGVPGVISVINRMVADRDLTIEVAQTLAKDERTRPYILRVGSYQGWVSLGGEVPTREARFAAEEVAGQVPEVRGVVSLPRVTGESENFPRRAVQPRIGASVYGENGQVGVISQVVIEPRNRLVSYAVVITSYEVEGWPVFGENLLPVEAIDQVNVESIFLACGGLPLSAYPIFDPEAYPRAPLTWQPPYPYTPGAVRWPVVELSAR